VEIEGILFELFLIFAAAKLAGELFERIKQPPVVGELLVGVILGSHALGVIGESEVHEVLQELGAIILLFMVGLDTHVNELREVGGRALSVGASGIVLPFALGIAFIIATDGSRDEAMFMGAAMVATSVGITARVLSDLGAIHEHESRIILGAAVVDDILGLLVLAVVSGLARDSLSVLNMVVLGVVAVGFVAIVAAFGHRATRALAPRVESAHISRGPLALALGVCLGLSALAAAIGLAAIIGAFLAGMAFAELRPRWQLEDQIQPVYELLVPFFFVLVGSQVDVAGLADGSTLATVAVVTSLAIIGKLVGCGAAAWGLGRRSALIVGTGMVPRGEVGLIVASVGLSGGLIDPDLFGVIVAMSIITTLVAPPALKALFASTGRLPPERPAHGRRTDDIEGIGG
jgi:Kef-type K+ transport system membrane component KefB